jgi:hypothetical protein
MPTRRILHTRTNFSRCICNKAKINSEYTMYSQDLPDLKIFFLTLKGYDRLYGLWVPGLQEAIIRVGPYFLRLLAVMINPLSTHSR